MLVQTLRLELQPGRDANQYGLQFGSNRNPLFRDVYIETDTCIKVCGLQRLVVGTPIDNILNNNGALAKLCSPKCQRSCGNTMDYYGVIMAQAGQHAHNYCRSFGLILKDELYCPNFNFEICMPSMQSVCPKPTLLFVLCKFEKEGSYTM